MIAGAHRTSRHVCDCHHLLEVFGNGRHRRFYESGDAGHEHPVMTRVCPSCQRPLPGKNPA